MIVSPTKLKKTKRRTPCLFVCAMLVSASLPVWAEDRPLIEIRPVVDCGTVPESKPLTLPQAQGRCLGRQIIVREADVLSASHQQNKFHMDELELMLRPEAGQRLNAYVRSHLGSWIAIDVDGRTVSVAFLVDPELSSDVTVTGISGSEADQIVDRLRAPRGTL